jgi:opacity protein-like surface antigen
MKIGKLLVSLVGSALIATSAFAADLPQAPTIVAPPPPPMAAPSFEWGGLYFGAYYAQIVRPEIGAHVGFNVVRGRAVFGIEAGGGAMLQAWIPAAFVKGRAGFLLSDRVLLYGMALLEAYFPGPTLVWMAGGGAELALGDRFSLFAEAGAIGPLNPFGCCGLGVRAGINIHPGN